MEDLLNRLTLDGKIDLIGGIGAATKEIKRLGIPELKMTEVSVGVNFGKSTAFPAGIAMAATWNPDLICLGLALPLGKRLKDMARTCCLAHV